MHYRLKKLLLDQNICPFDEWFETLQEQDKYMIDIRLARVRLGGFGEINNVGQGVWELKFRKGNALRIYYARTGNSILLLMVGGDKGTQQGDIRKAKIFFNSYQRGKLYDTDY